MAVKQAYGDASGWWGHPRGLYVLCAAEACERFSYFGMQTLLVLYMTHDLLLAGRVERVIGFSTLRATIESVTGPLSVTALASQIARPERNRVMTCRHGGDDPGRRRADSSACAAGPERLGTSLALLDRDARGTRTQTRRKRC